MTGRSLQVARGLNTIAARIVKNQDLLAEYGIALNNADGSMRSTFDILSDLSKIWGTLSDEERVSVGNTLAGTNQYKVLAAVMTNFQSALNATSTAMEAQGSAARENSRILESLEAKTTALRAAFQDLGNDVIPKELIAKGLDALVKVLELLDTEGGIIITRFMLLTSLMTGFAGISKFFIEPIIAGIKGIATVAATASGAVGTLGISLGMFLPAAAGISALVVAAIALKKAWDDAHPSLEDASQQIKSINQQIEDNENRIQEINGLQWYERTKEIENEREALERQNETLRDNLSLLTERQKKAAQSQYSDINAVITTGDIQYKYTQGAYLEEYYNSLEEADAMAAKFGGTVEAVNKTIYLAGDEAVDYLVGKLANLDQVLKENGSLTVEQKLLYDEYTQQLQKYQGLLQVLAESDLPEYKEKLDLVNSALKQSETAYQDAKNKISNYVTELVNLKRQSASTEEELYALVRAEIAVNNQQLNFDEQVEALRILASQAGIAASAISMVMGADSSALKRQIGAYRQSGLSQDAATQKAFDDYWNLMTATPQAASGIDSETVATGGGGGGSKQDAKLEALKSNVELLKSQLTILEKTNATDEERIAKIREIQDALHAQAEYLRSIGASEAEINALSASWADYQNQIYKILQEQYKLQADALQKQADAYSTLGSLVQDYADEQIKALNDQLDALEAANEELKTEIEYEQKLDDLSRARQSKVMVYKDGRFQYVEDVDEVSAAASNLETFEREQALNAERKAIEDQIQIYEDYKSAWANLADDYQKESDRQLIEQQLHIDLEKANWDTMLANAQDYVGQYTALMRKLTQAQTLANGASMGGASGVDWSALWAEAQADTSLSATERKALQEYYHAQKVIEMQGTGKSYDPTTGSWYASGTLSAKGGMSLVGENGPELRVLNSGDGILPSSITANLWRWGEMSPASFVKSMNLGSLNQGQNMNVTIQSLNLPNVTNGEGFVDYVRNNLFGQVMSFVH